MLRKLSAVSLLFGAALVPVPAFGLAPADTESTIPVVASGVVQIDGVPISGVDVTAFASPTDDALEVAGDTGMRLLPLASETTPASGRFELHADLTSLPDGYMNEPDGGTDIKLLVTDDSGSIVWNYTVFTDHSVATAAEPGLQSVTRRVATSEKRNPAETSPRFAFDLGQGTAFEVGNSPSTWVDGNGRSLTAKDARGAAQVAMVQHARGLQSYARTFLAASGAQRHAMLTPGRLDTASTDAVAAGCGVQYWTDNYKRNVSEQYVNVYSASGIPVTVTQGTTGSTSHKMGIALEKSGGSLSASGTRTLSYSHKSTQSNVSDAKVYNAVNYRDRITSCLGGEWMQVSMYDWFTKFEYAPHVNFAYCSSKTAGNTWATGSASNKTYGGGVSFPGLSLSAHSGYGSSQDLTYHFNVSGKICGNNVNGPLSSSQVSAKH